MRQGKLGERRKVLRILAWKADLSSEHFSSPISLKGYNGKSLHLSPFWTSMTPCGLPIFVGACVRVCFDGKYDMYLCFHRRCCGNKMYWQIWPGFLGSLLLRRFSRDLCEGLWSARLKPQCHKLNCQAKPLLTAWEMSGNSQWLVEAREFMLAPHLSFPSHFFPPG